MEPRSSLIFFINWDRSVKGVSVKLFGVIQYKFPRRASGLSSRGNSTSAPSPSKIPPVKSGKGAIAWNENEKSRIQGSLRCTSFDVASIDHKSPVSVSQNLSHCVVLHDRVEGVDSIARPVGHHHRSDQWGPRVGIDHLATS